MPDNLPTVDMKHRAAVRRALRDTVFAGQWPMQRRVRDAVTAVGGPVRSGRTHAQRNAEGYRQLHAVVRHLGPSTAIAADAPLTFSLFDWAAVGTPDLFPLLSGHFTLTVGALQRLGDGTPEQERALA